MDDINMTQPSGFEILGKSLVCRLNKAMYGLKQDPPTLVSMSVQHYSSMVSKLMWSVYFHLFQIICCGLFCSLG